MINRECIKLISESGIDPSGLSQWNWVQMRNEQRKITLISAYQCVKSRQTTNTVYNQHLRHFQLINRPICPRDTFCDNLIQFLSDAITNNSELILCIDMNENAFDSKLQRLLSLLDLIEASS